MTDVQVGNARLRAVCWRGLSLAILFLTGTWILNGLCVVWVVHKMRRIRAAANSDAVE